jgi:hypothetical protein
MSTTDRWDELFLTRKWRVGEEFTGTATRRGRKGPVSAQFSRGNFTITGGAYRSPLSTNLGRHGVLLVETNADGSADIPGSRLAVGAAAVTKARQQYGAVW